MKHDQEFKLRHLLGLQKPLWLIAWLFAVATVLSMLGLLMVAGWFVTMTAVAGVAGVVLYYALPSLFIRVFAITRTLARYGDLMVSHHAIFGLLKQLRVKFFARWVNLPLQERHADADTSSQKMHRLVKDIDVLNELPLRFVSPYLVAMVAMVAMSLMLMYLLPQAVWAVGLLVMTLLVAFFALKKGVQLAQDESIFNTRRQSRLLDTLPALHQLLIWGRWQDLVKDLTALDKAHLTHTKKINALKRQTSFINQLIMAVVICVVLWVAHKQFVGGVTLTAEVFMTLNPAFVLALVFGLFGLIEVVMLMTAEPLALGRANVAKGRLNELIYPKTTVSTKTTLNDKVVSLSLQNADIKMPNALVGLQGINATLNTKVPTLIIGASGAGKSTLLATLAGEIPLAGGQILINGKDMGSVDFGNSLGFLGQTVDIFDQTLRDNLRLGLPKFDPFAWRFHDDDDELWAVLDKVGLLSWAKSQPKGLDTPLGEYGMAISGGQARRIALARLLLSPKEIMLLDEPFAGLDVGTRHKVWTSLKNMQRSGEIGVLAIATHQLWDEMGEVGILQV